METPPHRFLALFAFALAAMALAVMALRDSYLVPLLTGNEPGGWFILDPFWTPLLGWVATGSLAVSLLLAGLAGIAWTRQATWRGLRPRQVALGLIVLMALLGIVAGLLAALVS